MVEGQIHLPRQQQVIDGMHQLQAIDMGDRITHQTQIHIRSFAVAAHGPGPKQPDLFNLWVLLHKLKESLTGHRRQTGDLQSQSHQLFCSCC